MTALAGRVGIVTGGASGIGRATAVALAGEGAQVVVADVDRDGLDATVAAVADVAPAGAGAYPVVADVGAEADAAGLAGAAVERYGRIDVLVAAAGILRAPGSPPRTLWATAPDEWDAVIATNLRGTFLCDRAVLDTMIGQRSGSIVNISSVSGRVGRAYDSAYCASKFGVIGLSESLREEVQQYNVRVNVVLPDAVATPFWDQNGPLPRPAAALDPARVADLIVYLVTLPEDTILLDPVIAPFRSRRRRRAPAEREEH